MTLATCSICQLPAALMIVVVVLCSTASGQAQTLLDKGAGWNALPKVQHECQTQRLANAPIVKSAPQVADTASFSVSLNTPGLIHSKAAQPISTSDSTIPQFTFDEQKDRLRIAIDNRPIVDFVFRDERILRPYFANARLADGRQATRNHPPVEGTDAVDHDQMHPGIWLGFGDINEQDFWRNKASIEHVRFSLAPKIDEGRLRFATECRLKNGAGDTSGSMTNDFTLAIRPCGWLLVWSAEFHADHGAIVFGDQEEMGFGARVATPLTEKNGGFIRSSTGKTTAKETWGQPAAWCDYSGRRPNSVGMMLMASPDNFRECWWHNRDYGVFVANPFGRAAMKQGARSQVEIAPGQSLRLTFGALIHNDEDFKPADEYAVFRSKP